MKSPDRVNEADKKAYFKCEWHHSIDRHPGLKEKEKVSWALPYISLLPDWMWCAPPPPSPASMTPFPQCLAPLYKSNSALPTQVAFYFVTTKGVTQMPCNQRIPPPGVPRGRKSAITCIFFFFPCVHACVCLPFVWAHVYTHMEAWGWWQDVTLNWSSTGFTEAESLSKTQSSPLWLVSGIPISSS